MTNLTALIAALIMVESSGNDRAVDASRQCWGPLQIRAIYVRDVNRIAGTHYVHADAFNRRKSVAMFRIYMKYFATRDRLGHAPTWQDIARIHAGGPDGWRAPVTLAYWYRVRRVLSEQFAEGGDRSFESGRPIDVAALAATSPPYFARRDGV